MAQTHTVEQGQSIGTIAREHDIADWRWLWNHPDNAPVRALREDPHVLAPGDEVVIPEREPVLHSVSATGRYRFVARRPAATFRLFLRDEGPHADPLASLRWELCVGGQTLDGHTAADGLLEARLPDEHDGTATLKVWLSEDDEDPFEWDVQIGSLDPADTTSGLWARLENLAFDCGDDDDAGGSQTDDALAAFTSESRIDPDAQDARTLATRLLLTTHRS